MQAIAAEVEKLIRAELEDALDTKKYEKTESYARVDAAKAKVVAAVSRMRMPRSSKLVKRAFDDLKERIFRDQILHKRERPDKRRVR